IVWQVRQDTGLERAICLARRFSHAGKPYRKPDKYWQQKRLRATSIIELRLQTAKTQNSLRAEIGSSSSSSSSRREECKCAGHSNKGILLCGMHYNEDDKRMDDLLALCGMH
ncbi:unnamed protein product, partial [Ceratitis capitata]